MDNTQKQNDVIKGLMNGNIHHSTSFKTLMTGNPCKSYTRQHNFGRRVGIATALFSGYGAICGILYGISKTNINEKLFKGICVVVIVIFTFWTMLTTICGQHKEYLVSKEPNPSFINGFVDGIVQTFSGRAI